MAPATALGRKIRSLRRQAGLTQAALAQRLGVSASYLNLLEHDRRAVTADLLLKVAQVMDVDIRSLASGPDAQLVADVTEALSDPALEDLAVKNSDVDDLVGTLPQVARGLVELHHAYQATRSALEALQSRVLDDVDVTGEVHGIDKGRLFSEHVSDFLQRHQNYFPEIEAEAERVALEAALDPVHIFAGMTRYLELRHRVKVLIKTVREMGGAVRRYEVARREIHLSEALSRSSRNFELAAQIGLLDASPVLDRLVQVDELSTPESRQLGRVALGNYFAAALLMPYDKFLHAAENERYDIEILGHRFGASWEQVCHRLTTLKKPGAEGVAFYFVRVDIAGNISKRFSAAGIQFPRYSGLCGLWNVHAAFLQPGRVRVQLARQANGHTLLAIAKTVRRYSGGFRAPDNLYAVGVGCDVRDARNVVYADGWDVTTAETAVPIGVTCRLCEISNCSARATPALHRPLRVDENIRGISFFAPIQR